MHRIARVILQLPLTVGIFDIILCANDVKSDRSILGTIIVDRPQVTFRRGLHNAVPVLMGSNTDEANFSESGSWICVWDPHIKPFVFL